jgi:hypothetical protein
LSDICAHKEHGYARLERQEGVGVDAELEHIAL